MPPRVNRLESYIKNTDTWKYGFTYCAHRTSQGKLIQYRVIFVGETMSMFRLRLQNAIDWLQSRDYKQPIAFCRKLSRATSRILNMYRLCNTIWLIDLFLLNARRNMNEGGNMRKCNVCLIAQTYVILSGAPRHSGLLAPASTASPTWPDPEVTLTCPPSTASGPRSGWLGAS